MLSCTKVFTLRDGNGRLTSITLGWSSDDPFADTTAIELTQGLRRLVDLAAQSVHAAVVHEYTTAARPAEDLH